MRKKTETYVASSREYIRSSYMTSWADIGCLVGDVETPITSGCTCCPGKPASASMFGKTHATQAAKNLPQGEKWAPISLEGKNHILVRFDKDVS